jgi:cyclophilin family peptidyl-prolyl cis-trans isomerase
MSKKIIWVLVLTAGLLLAAGGEKMAETTPNPVVRLKTSAGAVRIELYPEQAPVTVENFLSYVKDGFYDGTLFHRVIPGFMAQGGGFVSGMTQKETKDPIKNEAGNGLKNARGTIAMARTAVVDSATAQFFINVADNAFLDHTDDTPRGFGYAVFGKVIEGMEVVDKIVNVPTAAFGHFQDVPREDAIIISAAIE